MKSLSLIEELIELTKKNMQEAIEFSKLSPDTLNFKKDSDTWSILECIEHLNRYGNFYIPVIDQSINASKHEVSEHFKPGILGDYFAKSMLPKEKLNKMNTFKSMNPAGSNLDSSTLDTFIKQQDQLIKLLEISKQKNLTKIKTPISISKWIKLRLGDTFRVVIYHNLRHIVQAKKVIN